MTSYAYDPFASREVRDAHHALATGLATLRVALTELLTVAVRGDGSGKPVRSRPPTDPPARATGVRASGGRVATPTRPGTTTAPPAQRPASGDGGRSAADTVVIPLGTADTVVLPAVSGGHPTGQQASESPDQPDPDDPASEVWRLIRRAQAGDAEAFGQIYDRYVDTVFRFVYFRVGNRQLAEDLTADTFLRALRRIGSFTWQGRDIGAWLVTIARNLVADHFKSGRYRLEVTTSDLLEAEREERGLEGNPETAVVDHITNVALLTAVKQLNPEQQECIVLRFLQGFSVAETAKAMGKNEGAIKALQYRAVRTLARLLPKGFQP